MSSVVGLPGLLLLYAVYAAGLAVSISAAMGQFLRQFLWRSPVPSLLPFTPLEPLRYSITHPHPPLAGLSLSEVPLSLRHLPPPVCIGAAYSGFGGCLAGVSQAVSRGGQHVPQEPGARSQEPRAKARSQEPEPEPGASDQQCSATLLFLLYAIFAFLPYSASPQVRAVSVPYSICLFQHQAS